MKILKTVQKVPGGLMVVPLLLAAIVNTFFPQILQIGSFTTAVFSNAGAATAVGIQLFFIGTQLRLKEAPEALKRGGVLLLTKFFGGAAIGIFTAKVFGPVGFLGISGLAIISSVSNSNGSLYLALMGEYGDSSDQAAQSVLNLNDGPFLTLIALGASGLANIPVLSLIAAIGPLLVGVVLGNLDQDIRDMMKPGVVLTIPFIGFALGAGINLTNIINAGASGVILGAIVMMGSGVPLLLADRYILKRPGYAAAALSSAAGNSIATPAAVALVDPTYAPYVASATTQIAGAVVLTAILVPMFTAFIAKKYGSERDKKMQNFELAEAVVTE
ncbi:MAG: 2-keto-3-deoxygluconate permease [Thermotaleaceae bacterium]